MVYKIDIAGFIGTPEWWMDGDAFSLKDLQTKLAAMPKGTTEIDVIINSGGGYVTEGFAIHDLLATQTIKVNTTALGICGSIATVIAQAPKSQNKGGTRKGYQNTVYFIHNPSWTPQSAEPLEAEELQKIADELRSNEGKLINFYASTTGKDAETFKVKMNDAESLSMTDAKDIGLIDEIITTNIQAATVYKFAANIKTTNPMKGLEATVKGWFAELKNEVLAAVKPQVKNSTVKTSEGVDIYYDGELTEGTKVYTDVEMTKPAPDGVHTVGTKLYTIAGGAVSKVEDIAMDAAAELATAKADVARLAAELATATSATDDKINAAIANKETELTTRLNTEVEKAVKLKETELTNLFNGKIIAFETKYFTGGKINQEMIQNFKGEGDEGNQSEYAGKSPLEIAAAESRKKREAEKK